VRLFLCTKGEWFGFSGKGVRLRSGEGWAAARARITEDTEMCRNIRTLFNFEPEADEEEIRAAALQYIRKISGFTRPSKANEAAFEAAVEDVARVSGRLLAALETTAPPKDRETEAAKARARAALRYAT
jgi:hypothetical protein